MLIPILNPNLAQDLVELAQAITGFEATSGSRRLQIVVLGIVQVPEATSLSEGASLVRAYRTMLRYIPPENDERIEVRTEVRVAREVWQGITDQVREDHTDLLLLHWKGFSNTPGKIYGTTLDELMCQPPCDMVLARFNNLPAQRRSILLPVRGGSYSALALRFASNLVQTWHANLTVLNSREQATDAVVDGVVSQQDLQPGLLESLGGALPLNTRILTMNGSPLRRIAGEAVAHDLIILGAGAGGGDIETMDVRLARETKYPLLICKTRRPLEIMSPPQAVTFKQTSLPEEIDRWFAENTFHYREFRTMSSLTLLKERNNLSVSLVFPVYSHTLPVTLAETVRRARYALIHDCALVDEIIVAVSSTPLDPTEIRFFEAGIDGQPDHSGQNQDELVFVTSNQTTLSPGLTSNGPTFALRAALEHARGDIIVWADPTIPGFEARLVYGLVGPLVSNPSLHFATGFYSEQPPQSENNIPLDFDYLTDLALRPLIGTFVPQLAGILDPLCSVGAVRRELLEKLPFFTGQGFNLGLLIDTLQLEGLMAIAQVDLGTPPGSSCPVGPQQLVNQVLSVLMHRLEERSHSSLMRYLDLMVKTVHKIGPTYSLHLDNDTQLPRELPPVANNPHYVRHSF